MPDRRARSAARHVALEDYGEAHHVYIRSLTIHNVSGSDNEKANGGINYTCSGKREPSRFVDLRIEHNGIYHVDRSGIFGWSDRWERSKWYPSLGVAVRGNVLDDIGGDGIVVVATDGAVVEHNIVGHANQTVPRLQRGDTGHGAPTTLLFNLMRLTPPKASVMAKEFRLRLELHEHHYSVQLQPR